MNVLGIILLSLYALSVIGYFIFAISMIWGETRVLGLRIADIPVNVFMLLIGFVPIMGTAMFLYMLGNWYKELNEDSWIYNITGKIKTNWKKLVNYQIIKPKN